MVPDNARAVDDAGIPISFPVLFGSQAQDSMKARSDFGQMAVRPHFDGPRFRADIGVPWHAAARIISGIEPDIRGLQPWNDFMPRTIIEMDCR